MRSTGNPSGNPSIVDRVPAIAMIFANQSDRNPGLWPEHDLHLCQRRRGFDVLRV